MGTNLPRATPGMGALHRWTRRKFIVVIPARLLVIRAPRPAGTGGVYASGRSGVNPTDDDGVPRRMT